MYRHRNDPHHRNDTYGNYRNDPRNLGNGLQKLNNNLVRFFIYLYCIFFTVCDLPFTADIQ